MELTFLMGLLIGVAVMSFVVVIIIKADENKNGKKTQDIDVADTFNKMWDAANSKAFEASVFKFNEYPLKEETMGSESGRKFLDDKREMYLCHMISMYQLNAEEQ